MTAIESPTTVRWISKFTGKVIETPLGTADFAEAYSAALQRSGHTIVRDQPSEGPTPLIDTFAEKWAIDEATGDQPIPVEDFKVLLEESRESIPREIYDESRLAPATKKIIDEFEERQKTRNPDGLEDRSIVELRRLSSNEQLGINGAWGLKKPFLIAAIREARAAKVGS